MAAKYLAWVSPVLLIAAAIYVTGLRAHYHGVDYYNFWAVPQFAGANPAANIYDVEAQSRWATELRQRAEATDTGSEFARVARYRENLKLHLSATPLQYAALAIFQNADFETGLIIYQTALILLFVASIFLMGLAMGYRAAILLPVSAALLFLFGPVQWDVEVGNVNQFQLIGVAAILFLMNHKPGSRFWIIGAILGLETVFKPNFGLVPAVLFAYWLHVREFKTARQAFAGAAAGAALGIATGALYFGSMNPWFIWARETLPSTLGRSDWGTWMANFAPAQVVQELTGFDLAKILIPAVLAGLIFFALRPRKNSAPKMDFTLIAGLACVAALLSTKLVWFHYETLFLPLIFFVFKNGGNLRVPLALATVALGMNPCLWSEGSYTPVWINLAGTLGVFALGLAMLRRHSVAQQP